MPKQRRIKKAQIQFVTLCPRGKNRVKTLYKEDGSFVLDALVHKEDEGTLLAVVYAPEFRDSEGDIASAEVVKEMAYSFMQQGGKLDLRHDGKALSKEDAYVAENFIVQKGDTRFDGMTDYDGNPVNVEGAWASVIKLESQELRDLYSKEGWQGVSLAGLAQVVTEKSEEDTPMNEQQIKALTEALAKATSEAVTTALQKSPDASGNPQPEADPEPGTDANAPVFSGDPLSKEDLESYRQECRSYHFKQRITKAAGDPAEVAKILKEIEAGDNPQPEADPEPSTELQKAQDDLKAAQDRIAKLEKAGAAPTNPANSTNPSGSLASRMAASVSVS